MTYDGAYRAARTGNLHVTDDGTFTVGNGLPVPPENAALIADLIALGELVVNGTEVRVAR